MFSYRVCNCCVLKNRLWGSACIYLRKLKRGGFFATLRLSFAYVSYKGRKYRGDQKEPDDNPDKLVRVMKTEPRV